ncbi:MAG: hypothetical protein N2450_01830 [bacterium]|nr:hypothetical protein [bacterium]
MRSTSPYDRTRSMRINRTLRNISFSLAFVSFSFAVLAAIMLHFEIGNVKWWELFVLILLFLILFNLGFRFHVAFKRKD